MPINTLCAVRRTDDAADDDDKAWKVALKTSAVRCACRFGRARFIYHNTHKCMVWRVCVPVYTP